MPLNVAVVAPAATVSEAGTESRVLLLASVTVAPPVGATVFSVNTQLELALEFRLAGVHATDEMVGTRMIPVVPADAVTTLPVVLTPIGFAIEIEVVPAVGARVS